jgi:hypothetical protein
MPNIKIHKSKPTIDIVAIEQGGDKAACHIGFPRRELQCENVICGDDSSSSSGSSCSSNPYSTDSSSCSSNPYSSDSSSSCGCGSSSSESNPYSSSSSSSSSSSNPYSSSSSSSCTCSSESNPYSSSSSDCTSNPYTDDCSCSTISSYFKQKRCFVSLGPNNQIPDYSQGISVPLPLCDQSCKTTDSKIHPIRPLDDPTQLHGSQIKVVLKQRIKGQTSIIFDQEALKKGLVLRYENLDIYPFLQGYILLKWMRKPRGGEIDINYYQTAEKQGKPIDISLIYIEDPFLKKILEEEIDLQLYCQTLLRDNYKEYHARVHIIHPVSNMVKKINMRDVAFYSGMSYLLLKALI